MGGLEMYQGWGGPYPQRSGAHLMYQGWGGLKCTKQDAWKCISWGQMGASPPHPKEFVIFVDPQAAWMLFFVNLGAF